MLQESTWRITFKWEAAMTLESVVPEQQTPTRILWVHGRILTSFVLQPALRVVNLMRSNIGHGRVGPCHMSTQLSTNALPSQTTGSSYAMDSRMVRVLLADGDPFRRKRYSK